MTNDTTTVESRRAALADMALDVEEFIAAAHDLPRDYVMHMIDTGAADDALVEGGGLRPWALALLYLTDELALLVTQDKLTKETAAAAWTEVRPKLQEAFEGLVARQYDLANFDATLTPRDDVEGAEPLRLVFMQRAVVRFFEWVVGEKFTEAPST